MSFSKHLRTGFLHGKLVSCLRAAHVVTYPKWFTIVDSEAIEYNLMSGLFIWFLTSFSSSCPLFWWILYELFWINKSHQSFHFDSLPSTPVKLDQTQRLVWFSEISAVWKHQFSLCYLTGKPSWFICLIPSTTLCSTSQ